MGGIINLIFSQSGLFPIWAILKRSDSQLERFQIADLGLPPYATFQGYVKVMQVAKIHIKQFSTTKYVWGTRMGNVRPQVNSSHQRKNIVAGG